MAVLSKKNKLSKEVGNIAVRLGELMFGSLVLGAIINGDYDRMFVLLIGGVFAFSFIVFGIILIYFGEGGE